MIRWRNSFIAIAALPLIYDSQSRPKLSLNESEVNDDTLNLHFIARRRNAEGGGSC